MEKLKFDPKDVNIDLALEFFKTNHNTFSGYGGTEKGFDGWNEVIYNIPIPPSDLTLLYKEFDVDYCYKLHKLARLFEENAELFAQIEFAIRKRPKDEVKKYDIPLIVGYLRDLASNSSSYENIEYYGCLNEAAPLANLGFQFTNRRYKETLLCTIHTAAVSFLFSQLCSEAGFHEVRVIVFPMDFSYVRLRQDAAHCLGVVTGYTDVDSAVDVFIRSTTKYPWKLSRILVEESIYDRFKSSLSWKCRENDGVNESDKFCSDVFKYGDKTFLCDYAGEQNVNGVYVEAYRTTKELLNLIDKNNPFYLTLWSNNISEANEIAYDDRAPYVVWINDYGIFGPPKASLPFYEMIFDDKISLGLDESDVKKIDTWRKMSPNVRREKIISAIDEILAENDNPDLKLIKKELYSDTVGSFTVSNSQLCTCRAISKDFYYNQLPEKLHSEFLKLLIDGCYIISYERNTFGSYKFPDDIPIIPKSSNRDKKMMQVHKLLSRTKIVWSSHGTIFAN